LLLWFVVVAFFRLFGFQLFELFLLFFLYLSISFVYFVVFADQWEMIEIALICENVINSFSRIETLYFAHI